MSDVHISRPDHHIDHRQQKAARAQQDCNLNQIDRCTKIQQKDNGGRYVTMYSTSRRSTPERRCIAKVIRSNVRCMPVQIDRIWHAGTRSRRRVRRKAPSAGPIWRRPLASHNCNKKRQQVDRALLSEPDPARARKNRWSAGYPGIIDSARAAAQRHRHQYRHRHHDITRRQKCNMDDMTSAPVICPACKDI